jgi:hypothetical protein
MDRTIARRLIRTLHLVEKGIPRFRIVHLGSDGNVAPRSAAVRPGESLPRPGGSGAVKLIKRSGDGHSKADSKITKLTVSFTDPRPSWVFGYPLPSIQ